MQAEMKYIAEVKKTQSTIRRIRHDLKNRNLVLMGLLDQHKITEAKNYLAKSFDQLAKTSTFYTNDPVLNYLLNEKNALAQANHIDFQIHVLISKQISLDNDILSVLIGNLIDNAIEANQRLNAGVSRYINLTIKQFKKDLLIEISNPYDDA
ncbi:GHKL domain-containing protein, partial [Pediococcus acidilactici]